VVVIRDCGWTQTNANRGGVSAARAIQDQLLRDFGARSEFSDWFAREDAPKPPVPVVLQPNPRNVDYDAKIAELEAKIERYFSPFCILPPAFLSPSQCVINSFHPD
jgi:hypothetical protein